MSDRKVLHEELPLTDTDKSKLRKQLIPLFIFPIFIIGFFVFIFNFVLDGMGDNFMPGNIFKVIFGLFGVFFMGIVGYMFWAFFKDLKGNVKHRITGNVTDRRLDINTTTSSSRGSGGSRTRTKKSYFIAVDGKEYTMDYPEYARVKIGDTIVMDKSPKAQVTLYLEVLKSTVIEKKSQSKEEASENTAYLKTEVGQIAFNQRDLDALKDNFKKGISTKLIWMAIPMLIIISFITSEMMGLLVIFFPVVIIAGVQVFKLIGFIITYFTNKNAGYKDGVTALVEDKLTITHNRSKTKYQVKTTSATISVPEEAYNKLSKDDKLIIFSPKNGKKPLNIVTMANEEYYLS